jgi:nitrite reductase/ring-hydroxylating ferredoxin subunit
MTDLATAPRNLGPSEEIEDGAVAVYYLGDRKRRVSVARVDGRLYAFDDLCTCAEPPCPLSGGLLTGTTIMCQCHGSRFDVTDGAVIKGPASVGLHTYEVRDVDGRVEIRA